MLKNSFLLLTFLCFIIACNQTPKQAESPDKDTSEASAEKSSFKSFGENITADGSITYDELLTKMDSADSLNVKVKGKVTAVCQAKGCWMNIATNDPEKQEMFVKFKDYGFFMPLDIAGKEVIMEGKAFREVTSVDELRHYAEDEGKSSEEIAAITEPIEELKFMASGVLLVE